MPKPTGTVDWLRDLLLEESNGLRRSEIIKIGKANHFSLSAIDRAKVHLGLIAKTSGFGKDKASIWCLPITATKPANFVSPEVDNNGKNGGEIDAQN